jgi:hypothetical protein
MFLMPVIPFITDLPNVMEETIEKAKEIDLDFIIFSPMTLKEGIQKKYFFKTLNRYYPNLITNYSNIYQKNIWGIPEEEYQKSVHATFNNISKNYRIPRRIPPNLFKDILSENDLVIVILEHLDYLLRLEGKKSPYRWAANSISKLTEPLSRMESNLRQLNCVGPITEKIILEILKTGSSSYYEKLLTG